MLVIQEASTTQTRVGVDTIIACLDYVIRPLVADALALLPAGEGHIRERINPGTPPFVLLSTVVDKAHRRGRVFCIEDIAKEETVRLHRACCFHRTQRHVPREPVAHVFVLVPLEGPTGETPLHDPGPRGRLEAQLAAVVEIAPTDPISCWDRRMLQRGQRIRPGNDRSLFRLG